MTNASPNVVDGQRLGRPQAIGFFRKLSIVAPLAITQIVVYWLLNHYPVFASRELPLIWVDRAVPFWIWTIWAYFALIAMAILLPLGVGDGRAFRRLVRAYGISMGIAWLFFLTQHGTCRPATSPQECLLDATWHAAYPSPNPSLSRRYLPLCTRSTHRGFSRYHCTVRRRPDWKSCSGFQPSARRILPASIA